MRKIVVLGLALTAMSLASAADVVSAAPKEIVKVGAILGLSGDMQLYGNQLRDGMLLCLKDQEQKNNCFQYKLDFEDDMFSPRQAVLAYRKLTQLNGSEVILSNWAQMASALAPIAAHDKKMAIYIDWDDSVTKDNLAFIDITQPVPQAGLLVKTIHGLGFKRVAVVCLVQQGCIAMNNEITARAAELGIAVKTINYNPDEIDFRAHIMKFYGYHPDIYVILGFEPGFEIIIRRIRETGYKGPITSVEGYCFADDLRAYNGSFFVEGNQPTEEYKNKFLSYYKRPALGYSGLGYDMMALTISCYEKAGKKLGRKPTTIEAAAELSAMKEFYGATGSLSFASNRVIQSPAVLEYIEDGKITHVTLDELKKKLGK